jgi:hypothetical protein
LFLRIVRTQQHGEVVMKFAHSAWHFHMAKREDDKSLDGGGGGGDGVDDESYKVAP